MERYDMQKAARIWERVHASSEAEQNPATVLPALIVGERMAAATYLQLSRRFQGREARLLRQLYQEEQSHVACLQGIYTLITGEQMAAKTAPVPQGTVVAVLRKCYGEEMRSLAEYEQWASHREYGPVFARLVQQEREHCRMLLEILGMMKQ